MNNLYYPFIAGQRAPNSTIRLVRSGEIDTFPNTPDNFSDQVKSHPNNLPNSFRGFNKNDHKRWPNSRGVIGKQTILNEIVNKAGMGD